MRELVGPKSKYGEFRHSMFIRLNYTNKYYWILRSPVRYRGRPNCSVFRLDGWYNYPRLIETVNWNMKRKK